MCKRFIWNALQDLSAFSWMEFSLSWFEVNQTAVIYTSFYAFLFLDSLNSKWSFGYTNAKAFTLFRRTQLYTFYGSPYTFYEIACRKCTIHGFAVECVQSRAQNRELYTFYDRAVNCIHSTVWAVDCIQSTTVHIRYDIHIPFSLRSITFNLNR